MKDVEKHMNETGQFSSCDGFFDNEDNSKIYEDPNFMMSHRSSWVTIDNQILREFYIKTLGEFSGY